MIKQVNDFTLRHNGPRCSDEKLMLQAIGVQTVDQLIDETVPAAIRLNRALNLPDGISELECQLLLKSLGAKNKLFKSYIGMGYYNSILPGVIQRNILENPGWYTSYTPYQAEVSQGRLEALLIFQTMISDLTGLPIANASLLDEGTAAAEAMIMLFNIRSRAQVKNGANKFFISNKLFAHTIEVLKTRSEPLNIELVYDDENKVELNDSFFGAILQYPDEKGTINCYKKFVDDAHLKEIKVAVAADLLSLALLTPPGEWGADIVIGSNQRFGLPMGFGGPHAGYFATREEFKRNIPGRIIGVTIDAEGNKALRMALQTREQHIKREKATSNICTAQALLASMSAMYAVYHGYEGVKSIAEQIHFKAVAFSNEIEKLGYKQLNQYFFDTLLVEVPQNIAFDDLRREALNNSINLRYLDDNKIGVSIDEATSLHDLNLLISVFATVANKSFSNIDSKVNFRISNELLRISKFFTNPVFSKYHSETAMMRYLKTLENKDLSLTRAMIPLGSCTMKLNAATELFALSWSEFNNLHPFAPENQSVGIREMINDLEKMLCEVTGFAAMSFQPNSGASGEYAGLLTIRAYHISRGEGHRNVCLIPASAHGTNPASAAMAGMEIVIVKSDEKGNIDITDLKAKAIEYKQNLSTCMVTYPSTHGVFEEGILELIKIIHENGGQVYMDGANMNAQVGLTSPGHIGADVCHLNLHKTFAIPHGGGGPGVGPIGVAEHLKPFLPGHIYANIGSKSSITAVSSAPYGSAYVLTIPYAYMKLMGGKGLTNATKIAILNANYLKAKLEKYYKILYTGKNDKVAHEMILDCNEFSRTADVQVGDIAKRLMDYGFHAPTVAFPVHGTLMVEPTESEPKEELDRFIAAMISIKNEIDEIAKGVADRKINVIKKAPHTLAMIAIDDYKLPYSRSKAAFPDTCNITDKYWPTVTRVDDAYGDRNLMCTCYNPEQ